MLKVHKIIITGIVVNDEDSEIGVEHWGADDLFAHMYRNDCDIQIVQMTDKPEEEEGGE
tara:strand:+ start:275 stop:451 length:177 start_codon:yes stop_codon:yes gene_type:complete